MLAAEASQRFLNRQVFWLTARSGPEQPSHRDSCNDSGSGEFGGLAEHSGGPATDLHRFPYCPLASRWREEPVKLLALILWSLNRWGSFGCPQRPVATRTLRPMTGSS